MKKKYLLLILGLFVFASCAPIKIACVGDSITYGAGISGRDSLAYPQQLQKILGKKYEVINFGVSGATMLKNTNLSYWNLQEYKDALDFNPASVIIMLGTNDSKSTIWTIHKDEFVADYTEMINAFKNLKSKPDIYIALPPPVFEDNWNIQKEVVEFEILDLLKNIASENGIEIIDFFSLFQGKSNLLPDGVHPNAEGAKVMAKEVSNLYIWKSIY